HALTKVKFSAKVQPNQALYLSELSLHNLGSEGSFAYTTGDSKVGAWNEMVTTNVGFAIALSDETKNPIVSTDAINVTAADGATLVIPQERDKVDVSVPAPGMFTGNTDNSYIEMVYSLQNTTTGDWIVGDAVSQVTAYIPVDVAFNMNQVVNYIINFGTGNGGYDDNGGPIIDSDKMIQFNTTFTDWDAETDVDPTPTPPAPPTSNIPDAVFAEYLVGAGYVEKDEDGINYVATQLGLELAELEVNAKEDWGGDPKLAAIKSLAGIKLFPAIEKVMLGAISIESLDISETPVVKDFNVVSCPDLSSIVLGEIAVGGEAGVALNDLPSLTSITHTGTIPLTLTLMGCEKFVESFEFSSLAHLGTLIVSSSKNLRTLTEVSTLNVANCTSLTALSCQYIGLKSLNISGCANLKNIYCSSNQLDALDITEIVDLVDILCGDQKNATGVDKSMILTLTADQEAIWQAGWKDEQGNERVATSVKTK
ncbi:MAG: hypothetical protein ACRCZY_11710, partial [Phocaeicola sp.]